MRTTQGAMTVEDVELTLVEIRKVADDNEKAHILEDALHHAVLESIASGKCQCPHLVARKALTSSDIRFSRWCV